MLPHTKHAQSHLRIRAEFTIRTQDETKALLTLICLTAFLYPLLPDEDKRKKRRKQKTATMTASKNELRHLSPLEVLCDSLWKLKAMISKYSLFPPTLLTWTMLWTKKATDENFNNLEKTLKSLY